ncbi:hypothetical protein [Stakelama tenebrarum]|uniref:STAS/SEC14 domain-containing protein n=1 Tax=Stakelama tenebrarum TaxID=2711215 RepID=A0A6G6Y8Y9_9SPHN|nr:hypothetical protein [Sphingosinithalassobacter tenebrarum]QIG81395.1 hypothetical protein G5C33_17440 [Sphingosinithalassobacter tenebrarum]
MDSANGVIRTVASGLWEREKLLIHFSRIRRMIEQVRARGEQVLVLRDLRNAETQPPEIAQLVNIEGRRCFADADRLAVLTSSSLLKMQMKRAVSHSRAAFFLSPNAAMTWLTAYRQDHLIAN